MYVVRWNEEGNVRWPVEDLGEESRGKMARSNWRWNNDRSKQTVSDGHRHFFRKVCEPLRGLVSRSCWIIEESWSRGIEHCQTKFNNPCKTVFQVFMEWLIWIFWFNFFFLLLFLRLYKISFKFKSCYFALWQSKISRLS